MKLFVVTMAASLAVLAGCAPDRSAEIARLNAQIDSLREIAGPPPAALDSLYPPIAKAPLWKLAMFDMATPFTATLIKATSGDAAGAKKYYDRFRAAYEKASGLVPAWKHRFPRDPVEEFGAALGSGDPGKVMAAAQKVGMVCHDCHTVNMPKVQQLKLWPEFAEIALTDPNSGTDVKYSEFMMGLDMAMTGIGVGLEEGSVEAARRSFDAFNKAMGGLRESCSACHSTERSYFVDKSVQASIDALGLALRAPKPDPATVGGLMMKIGEESCGNCHLVHIPAAYTQARFNGAAGAPAAGSGGH